MREVIIGYWLEWMLALMAAALALAYRSILRRIKRAGTENTALREGLIALLRDRIVQAYQYHVDKGSWPLHSREAVLAMYQQYTTLGGNGAICTLIKKLQDLPIETREGGSK